jgi:uncharacterized RDD family membrane protein YckC
MTDTSPIRDDSRDNPSGLPSPPQPPFEPASLPRRIAASILDAGLLALVHFTASGGSRIVTAALFIAYHTFSLAVWSRTLGKATVGLAVKTVDGEHLRWPMALLRCTAGYLASAFFMLGFLHALRNSRRHTWHDEIVGSEVVQEPGALSLIRMIRAIDTWIERVDAWQKSMFAPFKRLRALIDLILWLTGIMALLQKGIRSLIARFSRTAASKAAASAESGVASEVAAVTATFQTASSVATAVVLAGATAMSYGLARTVATDSSNTGAPRQEIREVFETLSTGDVQITLTWKGPADIDLHVIDPKNERIFHRHTVSASNGRLERDDHADCLGDNKEWGVEHVFWRKDEAPRGRYQILVDYFKVCGDARLTPWRVEAVIDGKKKIFTGELEPDSQRIVADFNR